MEVSPMLVGRRYRLEFSPDQVALAEQVGRACRFVWNVALEQRRYYRQREAWIGYYDQARQLAEAKQDHPWLTEVPGHCLQQALMDLDRACRTHGTRRVRWRAERRWVPSFRFPEGRKIAVEQLSRRWARVKLPKFGWVRMRWSRVLGGAIRSATVSRDGNRWFASLVVENGQSTPVNHMSPDSAVGIDRGVTTAVATSDGRILDRQFASAGEIGRAKRLQQQLARQRKRSNRHAATRARLNRLYGRVRARRRDFAAVTAHVLASTNAFVVLEDLRIRNMTASAAGDVDQPGRRVRQKSGLNRAILGKGWHLMETALLSKARATGTVILKVNPAYTSLTCNSCGHVDPVSRESQARFRCTACGHRAHADVNAAKNILAAGLAVTGRGGLAVGRPAKRQPTAVRLPTEVIAPAGIPHT